MGVGKLLRSACDGLGHYLAGAGLLLLLAVLALLLMVQSPSDELLWTGTTVPATERGGLVFYSWHGESYTLDVPGYANRAHLTVYLDPSDPETAITGSIPRRVLDCLFIGGPAALSFVVLGIGVRRRRSIRRSDAQSGFGRGLDRVLVDRLLEQGRRPPP